MAPFPFSGKTAKERTHALRGWLSTVNLLQGLELVPAPCSWHGYHRFRVFAPLEHLPAVRARALPHFALVRFPGGNTRPDEACADRMQATLDSSATVSTGPIR